MAAAAALGCLFLLVLIATVWSVDWDGNSAKLASVAPTTAVGEGYNDAAEGNTSRPLGLSLLGIRADRDLEPGATKLSPGYLLPFEIASVHLLVVLIGAAYLARAKRRVADSEGE